MAEILSNIGGENRVPEQSKISRHDFGQSQVLKDAAMAALREQAAIYHREATLKASCGERAPSAKKAELVARARLIESSYGLTIADREELHSLIAQGSKAQSIKEPMQHNAAYETVELINEFLVLLSVEDRSAGTRAWSAIPKMHQMWLVNHMGRNGADFNQIWQSREDRERALCASVGYMLGLELSIQPEVYPDLGESLNVISNLDATGS